VAQAVKMADSSIPANKYIILRETAALFTLFFFIVTPISTMVVSTRHPVF